MIKSIKKIRVSKNMYKGFPFMLFLSLLAMLYITNAHKAEKKMRAIQLIEKECEETHWEYMSVRSDIDFKGTQSEIAKRVSSAGIQYPVEAPKVIKRKN